MSKAVPASTISEQETGFATTAHRFLGPGIIVIDRDGKIVSISTQTAHILGLPGALPAGSSLEHLPAPLQELVRQTLGSGAAASGIELEIDGQNHTRIIAAVSALPVRRNREVESVILAINDVGPARQLRETLWQTDRLANIGTLSAGMAHEIKNALVAGKTFIDLLLEKNRDSELVPVVRRELARIETMVTRILKFAGPDRPSRRAVSVHEIIEHSLRLIQPHRESRSIALEQTLGAEADLVTGDDYQLQQAFVNLFLNALEAMGPAGTLTIATETLSESGTAAGSTPTTRLRISIIDTGDGIAPENLDRLFEPFFTTKPEGTGLGLPITRRIIEDHQGTITVESAPRKGTTFRIVLPLHHAGPAA
jgi:two-component system sensor histidine kinase HydH